jgi:N-acyl-D-amino-acid deacylase
MICTDSSIAGSRHHFHPRLRSSFPRALGLYARDKGTVSIPEMIRKMTALPAHVYGLKTKGLIAVGMDADLCIFNMETLRDRADYQNPTLNNMGLEYVVIDGKIVLEQNVYNGIRAAQVYRKKV